MVIFTETMAKLVSELAGKSAKVTVSEDTIIFEFTGDETKKSPCKKSPRNVNVNVNVKPYRKNMRLYTFNGETHSIKEWAEKYSVPYPTMTKRLRRLGSPETTYRRGNEPKRVKKG